MKSLIASTLFLLSINKFVNQMNNKENSLPSEPSSHFSGSISKKLVPQASLVPKSPLQTLSFKNTQYTSPPSQDETEGEPSSPLDDYLMSRKRKWSYGGVQEWTFNLVPVDTS